MKWPEEYINQIICGDCLEIMKGIPSNSVDTIITDPPYGIGFMGKEWDNFKTSFVNNQREKNNKDYLKNIKRKQQYLNLKGRKLSPIGTRSSISGSYDLSPKGLIGFQEWMSGIVKEMLRVAKPGSTLLCFGGTRTFHRLACVIEDAGWILKDCIMWLYGSGFPKATDISKQLDKNDKNIAKYDFVKWMQTTKIEPKEIDNRLKKKHLISETSNFAVHFFNEGQPALPNKEYWEEILKICNEKNIKPPENIESFIDLRIYGSKQFRKREIINKGKSGETAIFQKDGGMGEFNVTAPATPEAILWNGWKSHGLKPAYEPILVAMKPNEGSYANNALKWKVAGLNIDGGRISLNGDKPRKANKGKSSTNIYGWAKGGINKSGEMPVKGRYPANVILDEEAGRMLDEQSGELKPPWGKESESQKNTSWFSGKTDSYGKLYRDIGGASRFFYCAKASKAERNKGCEELEEKISGGMKGTADQTLLTGSGNIRNNKAKNNHPTVKPLLLMKYLCILTKTPTGGIVLDPFCGSGTTLIACKELKRDYIGIDNNSEYCEIARRRINATLEPLF